jgi:hypothetical protein
MSQPSLLPKEEVRRPINSNPAPTTAKPAAPASPPPEPDVSARAYALGSIHTLEGLTLDGVALTRFMGAMMDQLRIKRGEGRTGWNDPARCTIAQLEEHLQERLDAGDIVAVGLAAMMIWNRCNPEVVTTREGMES